MNIHLPNVNMSPKDFEVSWTGVCSCKQALSLCLEQGYINTNNFFWRKLQQKHAAAANVHDFTLDGRYHCGAAVRPGGIDTAAF